MTRDQLLELEAAIDIYNDDDLRYLVSKAKKVRATIDMCSSETDIIVWKRPRAVTRK